MPAPGPRFSGPFWRVFPWDSSATPGEPYTPQYVLPVGAQTGGRFDLPHVPTLYIALENPAHALAEVLQSFRGKQVLRAGHLRVKVRGRRGVYHPRALVETWIPRWSAFGGQWHVAVLYMDRVDRFDLHYEAPELLGLDHPITHAAALELSMRIAGSK